MDVKDARFLVVDPDDRVRHDLILSLKPVANLTNGRCLEGRRSRRRCDLKALFVLQAIWRPGHCFKPALFDRSTVHDALAERAIGHAAQRFAHWLQHCRIVFGFGKFLGRHLVGDTRIANVMGRVDEFFPGLVGLLANPTGQSAFEAEQALLIVLNVHGVLPTTLRIQQRSTNYCLYRSMTEGGRTLASFGSWPNSRRASRWRSRSQH
jgi:hypothetical protein